MKILSEDSLFSRAFNTVGDMIIANIIFILTALPVVTAGAALCGLNYAFLKRRRRSDEPVTRLFLNGFKSNFRQASAAWLAFLALMLFLAVDLSFAINVSHSRMLTIFFACILAMVYFSGLWLFAVIPAFSDSLPKLILLAFSFAAGHIPSTLVMALVPTLAVVAMLSSFAAFWMVITLLLTCLFGAFSWACSHFYIRAFSPFLGEVDE